jgi:seryl-tRNA synthetase
MLDIKFIRENKDLVKEAARKKHIEFDVEKLIEADDKRKALAQKVDDKNREKKLAAESRDIEAGKRIKGELDLLENELREAMKEWQLLMLQVPNVPDISVPEGESDADNKEVKVWGEPTKFGFEPKGHIELMTNLGMIDIERGVKVAGFRGYFLTGKGAQLQFALWQFVNDFYRTKKSDFVPMIVPSMVRRENFIGTGYIPQSEEDLYKTQDGEYLAGTAEVATMGFYMNETLAKEELPKKMLSFSPAFRREIGAHGKDTKGILRVHEFYKFEQVVLCEASHEESVKYHEELQRNAEEITEALGLPYHVVVNCAGDLGLGQVKKYDIEVWMPSEGKYRETGSCSYFHDFQTRRLNIKYKDADGALKYAHSLNNTALSGRPLIMIVENYQQADGSIKIPDVLVPYMNGATVISK